MPGSGWESGHPPVPSDPSYPLKHVPRVCAPPNVLGLWTGIVHLGTYLIRHNSPGFPEKVNIILDPGKFLFSTLTGWPDDSVGEVLRVSLISSHLSCPFPGNFDSSFSLPPCVLWHSLKLT